MKERVMTALREHFKPEFLNRIDETVVFHALTPEQLKHIVDIQLQILNKRLEERKIILNPSDAARDWLARTGYDPVYGARPLKRLIQKDIENPLALKLLEGEFADGDRIIIDAGTDGLTFKKQPVLALA
jgi:ATP-dependent Clp protease ATP-binding subunit ClpB